MTERPTDAEEDAKSDRSVDGSHATDRAVDPVSVQCASGLGSGGHFVRGAPRQPAARGPFRFDILRVTGMVLRRWTPEGTGGLYRADFHAVEIRRNRGAERLSLMGFASWLLSGKTSTDPSPTLSVNLNSNGTAGPMAEFTALRAEMLYWVQERHVIVRFQALTAGSVLSYALAVDVESRRLIGLVVPVLSWILFVQHQYSVVAVVRAAHYVRAVLSPQVEGGLKWEDWLARNGTKVGHLSQPWTTAMVFGGMAAAGIAIATPTVWAEWKISPGPSVPSGAWCVSVAFFLAILVVSMRSVRSHNLIYRGT